MKTLYLDYKYKEMIYKLRLMYGPSKRDGTLQVTIPRREQETLNINREFNPNEFGRVKAEIIDKAIITLSNRGEVDNNQKWVNKELNRDYY